MTKFFISTFFLFLFTFLFSVSCATAPEAQYQPSVAKVGLAKAVPTDIKIKAIAEKAIVVDFFKGANYLTAESMILVRDYSSHKGQNYSDYEKNFDRITNLLEFIGANPQTGKRSVYLNEGLIWTSVQVDKFVAKSFRNKFSGVDFSILDDALSSGLSEFSPKMGVNLKSGKIEVRWSNINFFKFLVKAEKLGLSVPNSFIKKFMKGEYYTYLKLDGESYDSPI